MSKKLPIISVSKVWSKDLLNTDQSGDPNGDPNVSDYDDYNDHDHDIDDDDDEVIVSELLSDIETIQQPSQQQQQQQEQQQQLQIPKSSTAAGDHTDIESLDEDGEEVEDRDVERRVSKSFLNSILPYEIGRQLTNVSNEGREQIFYKKSTCFSNLKAIEDSGDNSKDHNDHCPTDTEFLRFSEAESDIEENEEHDKQLNTASWDICSMTLNDCGGSLRIIDKIHENLDGEFNNSDENLSNASAVSNLMDYDVNLSLRNDERVISPNQGAVGQEDDPEELDDEGTEESVLYESSGVDNLNKESSNPPEDHLSDCHSMVVDLVVAEEGDGEEVFDKSVHTKLLPQPSREIIHQEELDNGETKITITPWKSEQSCIKVLFTDRSDTRTDPDTEEEEEQVADYDTMSIDNDKIKYVVDDWDKKVTETDDLDDQLVAGQCDGRHESVVTVGEFLKANDLHRGRRGIEGTTNDDGNITDVEDLSEFLEASNNTSTESRKAKRIKHRNSIQQRIRCKEEKDERAEQGPSGKGELSDTRLTVKCDRVQQEILTDTEILDSDH